MDWNLDCKRAEPDRAKKNQADGASHHGPNTDLLREDLIANQEAQSPFQKHRGRHNGSNFLAVLFFEGDKTRRFDVLHQGIMNDLDDPDKAYQIKGHRKMQLQNDFENIQWNSLGRRLYACFHGRMPRNGQDFSEKQICVASDFPIPYYEVVIK
jgi:hypothetical protein